MTKKKTLKLSARKRVVPLAKRMFLASWCSPSTAEDMRDQSLADLAHPVGLILADDKVHTIARAQELAFEDVMSCEYPDEDDRPADDQFAWEQIGDTSPDGEQRWRLYQMGVGDTVCVFVISSRNVITG